MAPGMLPLGSGGGGSGSRCWRRRWRYSCTIQPKCCSAVGIPNYCILLGTPCKLHSSTAGARYMAGFGAAARERRWACGLADDGRRRFTDADMQCRPFAPTCCSMMSCPCARRRSGMPGGAAQHAGDSAGACPALSRGSVLRSPRDVAASHRACCCIGQAAAGERGWALEDSLLTAPPGLGASGCAAGAGAPCKVCTPPGCILPVARMSKGARERDSAILKTGPARESMRAETTARTAVATWKSHVEPRSEHPELASTCDRPRDRRRQRRHSPHTGRPPAPSPLHFNPQHTPVPSCRSQLRCAKVGFHTCLGT